jgi:glyoxylase-like metal-dependent hydrolase (beta-lactamase superfamily II)
VPEDDAARFWAALDHDVERRQLPVAVLLTQAAHSRNAGDVAARYDADVWGHSEARGKVGEATFHDIASGDDVPGGRVLEFEQERGSGTPLYLPSHRAIAVGDVFISRDDGLHVWWGHGADDDNWYTERLLPSLRRWLELEVAHLLVAHGPLVAPGELAAALERPPDRGA